MFKMSAQTADFLEKGLKGGKPFPSILHLPMKAYMGCASDAPYHPRWFREPCQGEQWQVYVPHDRARFGSGYRILIEPE